VPHYSGLQVLFNKLLDSMKIIQAKKISITVDEQKKANIEGTD
jgi:hypothetical protein